MVLVKANKFEDSGFGYGFVVKRELEGIQKKYPNKFDHVLKKDVTSILSKLKEDKNIRVCGLIEICKYVWSVYNLLSIIFKAIEEFRNLFRFNEKDLIKYLQPNSTEVEVKPDQAKDECSTPTCLDLELNNINVNKLFILSLKVTISSFRTDFS